MRAAAASIALAILVLAGPAFARDVPVSDAAGLMAAIDGAVAGDVILLADGTYALGDVRCNAAGRADAPIVVRAVRRLGARLELSGLEGFVVTGDHWHFEDLDVQGVCAPGDGNCEHAFHVSGARGFVLRRSRVRDFHAQLKVNALSDGAGGFREPHGGLVEHCEIADTAPRQTDAPVTKLNIDSGDDWVVRGNFIHDFHKNGGNEISYAAFMKSGGRRGLFERNLVVCTLDVDTGGTRVGLSFGGGGTAPQFCAPAFDASVPCDIEHADGVMRNNVIANCNDVGIYLNRSANTRLLHNTLIATSGIDFRFDTTTGEAHGNVLAGSIRMRQGGTFSAGTNLEMRDDAFFAALYRAPARGDLSLVGDPEMLVGGSSARADVPDDYCARTRPMGATTLGALEHSLGDCATVPPPEPGGPPPPPPPPPDGGIVSPDGGTASPDGGAPPIDGGLPPGLDAALPPGADGATPRSDLGMPAGGGEEDGCGCSAPGRTDAPDRKTPWLLVALGVMALIRMRRGSTRRRSTR